MPLCAAVLTVIVPPDEHDLTSLSLSLLVLNLTPIIDFLGIILLYLSPLCFPGTDYRPSVNLEMATSGHNALIRACSLGRASVVESLCDRGADVNYQNKFGRTPLHYAATVGSFVCCRILLERGADVRPLTHLLLGVTLLEASVASISMS